MRNAGKAIVPMLLAGAMLAGAMSATQTEAADMGKRLIEFGWDEPSTAFLREHVATMERMPFDGVVLNAHYLDAAGKDEVLEWTGFGAAAIPWDAVKPALADLRATPFHRFTDNFLRFNTTPGDVDWFDDFQAIVGNARVAARLAKEGGLAGLLFDIEQYNYPLFDYSKLASGSTRSFAEYSAQARLRGEQVMAAFQREYPGITLLMTFGYSLAGTKREDLSKNRYGLLAPFLDGLYHAARGRTRIVDGYESSYGYDDPAQFETAYERMHRGDLAVCSVPEAYRRHMEAGFGLWMDRDWRKVGWHTDDFSKNYFPPDRFERALEAALRRTDRYVWLYTEQPRWWPAEKLPDAYVQAVREAREKSKAKTP